MPKARSAVGRVVTSAAPSNDFITNFPAAEVPISQGGIWTLGGTDGLDWQDVDTHIGEAYGHYFAGGTFYGGEFDDPIAHLKTSYRTFANNQFAQGTAHVTGGYTPNTSHEIELLLRFAITAHNARGYETLWQHDGFLVFVCWNGPRADPSNSNNGYTQLGSPVNIGVAVHGDVLKVQIIGTVLTAFLNGSQVHTYDTASDPTKWSSGQPGMGFWPRSGGNVVLDGRGWQSFRAGDLP